MRTCTCTERVHSKGWLTARTHREGSHIYRVSAFHPACTHPCHCTQAHPRVRRWVALDDEELLEGPPNAARAAEFVGHAVRTESHVGLTEGAAELAISLLAQQPI